MRKRNLLKSEIKWKPFSIIRYLNYRIAPAVFTKQDPVIVDEFHLCVERLFPETAVVPIPPYGYRVSALKKGKRNPCITWLRQHGLMGKKSEQKNVPTLVFECSLRQQSVFLSALFSCDGWYHINPDRGSNEIGYCSASYELAESVRHLLLRFGIIAAMREKKVNGKSYWTTDIRTLDGIHRFIRTIGMTGLKGYGLYEAFDDRTDYALNPHDRIPARLVRPAVEQLKSAGLSTEQITGSPNRRLRLNLYAPSRSLVDQYAENTNCEDLHDLAAADIFWDQVAGVASVGMQ